MHDKDLALIKRIRDSIHEQSMCVDHIVALSRGGLIPGVYLSHMLDVPLTPVQWSTRDHAHCNIDSTILDRLKGLRILVVDDISDTGQSLHEVCAVLEAAGIEFNTAVLYQRHTTAFTATIVGEEVHGDEWIDFSWEKGV